MSATIQQSPGIVSLAGNPVLMKAYTNLSNKTFLKICVRLEVILFQGDYIYTQSGVFDLSCPTAGGGEAVWFDFSSCIRSVLSHIKPIDFDSAVKVRKTSMGYARYTFKVWDEYLDDNNEVNSSLSQASSDNTNHFAISGSLSDLQRYSLPEDLSGVLGDFKVMSNKPHGETVPVNERIIIPAFDMSGVTRDIMLDGNQKIGVFDLYAKQTVCKGISLPSTGIHEVSFSGFAGEQCSFHVINPHLLSVSYFEFINKLGALESIYCYGKRSESVSMESERNILYQGMTYKPSASYAKRNKKSEQVISLSTGPVSREWAKWFAGEFFQAGHVWMKELQTGNMVPVVVEPDGDVPLYKEGEAEVIDLAFHVTSSFDGYGTGRFT